MAKPFEWQPGVRVAAAADHGGWQRWWTKRLGASRSRIGRALLATCALLALLLAFQQVVSGAVRQGETRRQTSASQVDAAWRCKTPAGRATPRTALPAAIDCINPGVSP